MKYQRQLDPVLGVAEWDDLMQSVHVVAWVQNEPRKRVPLQLVRDSLRLVDVRKFEEVQAAVLMLMLLFTFARSETPCPKSHTGEGALDPNKHLLVRDVEVRRYQNNSYVAVRLKSIKQDARMERPEAAGGEDWIIIGDASGDFSILMWLTRLFAFHGRARDSNGPFFLDSDRVRALTYSRAMVAIRALWAKASSHEEAMKYGLHGLRVAGYNAGKRGKGGSALAVAQGGWQSSAHERYERFNMSDVIDLPNEIVSQCNDDTSGDLNILQRAPLDPTASNSVVARPRPDTIVLGTGPRLGSKRRRVAAVAPAAAPAAAAAAVVHAAPVKGDRIRVYWTLDRLWCSCVVLAVQRDGNFKLLYDPDYPRQPKHARTFVHVLRNERWRYESRDGS